MIKRYIFVISLLAASVIGGRSQDVLLWDFDGDLLAQNGDEIQLTFDGLLDDITYGNSTSLGLPQINGVDVTAMGFPKFLEFEGFWMSIPDVINGAVVDGIDPTSLNDYTFIADILYPTDSSGKKRGVLDTSSSYEDPEFFINGSNNLVVSGTSGGSLQPDSWHRIAWSVSTVRGDIQMFVDGVLVGTHTIEQFDLLDGRYALVPGGTVGLFQDDTGETEAGFVSSIQIRAEALSSAQMAALGGAEATGIPLELPPVPSYLEEFIPSANVALSDTEIGAFINVGTTDLLSEQISVTVDGDPVSSEGTREGDIIKVVVTQDLGLVPGQKVEFVISYTDPIDGEKSLEHVFDVAIWAEDFNSIVLGPNVDESLAGEEVWSKAGPDGWTTDDSGVPVNPETGANGVDEWAGWSFADYEWWVQAAGDQDRSKFHLADGAILVIDPDEWDDQPHGDGELTTILTTAPIDISGLAANTALLQFDSSWRPWSDMTGTVDVSFDGGEFQSVVLWESQPASPNFKGPDYPAPAGQININETVVRSLNNPEGAQMMQLRFGLANAGNDWWWALDNLFIKLGAAPPFITAQPEEAQIEETAPVTFSVTAGGGDPKTYQWFKGQGDNRSPIEGATGAALTIESVSSDDAGFYSVDVSNAGGTVSSSSVELKVNIKPVGNILYSEDFESLELGPNIDEGVAGEAVWTSVPPEGWEIDNSGVPGIESADEDGDGIPDLDGITEWAGWGFADRDWWAQTAGGQQRELFKTGLGTIAIADGDEWDDAPREPGKMTTMMKTPAIDISGIAAGSMFFSFSSAWRPYDQQKAIIKAIFDDSVEVEIVRWESDSNSGNFKPDNSQNENVVVPVNNPAGATSVVIEFTYADAGNDWYWAIDNLKLTGQKPPVFFEDFESVELGPNIDEGVAGDAVWNGEGPAGWSVDDSGVPGNGDPDNDGVTEWAGWGFADKDWWVQTAGDQGRSAFKAGTGTVAVADGDEWDDATRASGKMTARMSTPAIDISGIPANNLALSFLSAWNPYADQKAIITASFDGGEAIEVLRWESVESSSNFKAADTNEVIRGVRIPNPDRADSMVLTFIYADAGNDWYWAIDNIEVREEPPLFEEIVLSDFALNDQYLFSGEALSITGSVTGADSFQWFYSATRNGTMTAIPGANSEVLNLSDLALDQSGFYKLIASNGGGSAESDIFQIRVVRPSRFFTLIWEDFENVVLGPNIDEGVAGDAVVSIEPPQGWTLDDSGVPGNGDPDNDGVTEWAGWGFAQKDWWVETAGGQNRGAFTRGSGVVAIGDGDEWDDASHAEGEMTTVLISPVVSLEGIDPDSLLLQFDSAWRPWDGQTAIVNAVFDNGENFEVLRWSSDASSDFFKSDDTINWNEFVSIPFEAPENATTVQLTFTYADAGNDWFWAIDNIHLTAEVVPLFFEDFESIVLGANVDEGVAGEAVWSGTGPEGWSVDDSNVPGNGTPDQDGVTEWAGWGFANKDWWVDTAEGQARGDFKKGTGTVAIADGDEWDDAPHATGEMTAIMSTPVIDISGATPKALYLRFYSIWRPWDDQKAIITASFDGNSPVEILRWESVSDSPFFKADSAAHRNETVVVPIMNPEGASSLQLTFTYADAGNDWFWAVDNISVLPGVAFEEPVQPLDLSINLSAGKVTIEFDGSVLESAPSVNGPWAPVQDASSPYSEAVSNDNKFFRSR